MKIKVACLFVLSFSCLYGMNNETEKYGVCVLRNDGKSSFHVFDYPLGDSSFNLSEWCSSSYVNNTDKCSFLTDIVKGCKDLTINCNDYILGKGDESDDIVYFVRNDVKILASNMANIVRAATKYCGLEKITGEMAQKRKINTFLQDKKIKEILGSDLDKSMLSEISNIAAKEKFITAASLCRKDNIAIKQHIFWKCIAKRHSSSDCCAKNRQC